MLTKFDDYLIHQAIDTLDHVASGDPRFMDRGLFIAHGKDDRFYFQIGFGLYPNENMIDAFVCGACGNHEYNLRVARPLQHDRSDLNIGPLHIEIMDPMSVWKIWIDDNKHGIRCDLTFRPRAPAYEFQPVFIRRNNYVDQHQMHFVQSGAYEGWIQIGDLRIKDGIIGARDRSWGVRGKHKTSHTSHRVWLTAEFDDFAIHGWFQTDPTGRPLIADGTLIDIKSGVNRLIFRAFGEPTYIQGAHGYPEAVEMRLVDIQGKTHSLIARPLLARSAGGSGTQIQSDFFGRQRSSLHVEGEYLNTADPNFRREKGYMNGSMLAEYSFEGKIGYGAFNSPMLGRNV